MHSLSDDETPVCHAVDMHNGIYLQYRILHTHNSCTWLPRVNLQQLIYADVESYEQSGKHTFLPLSITNVTIILLLVSLAAIYRDLAPRCYSTEEKAATNATALASMVDSHI